MKKRLLSGVIILLVTVSFSHAATLSWSSTAPTVDGADIYNFTGAWTDANNIFGGNDAGTYIAGDRSQQGQTFTTGSKTNGYYLMHAITLQHVQYYSLWSIDAGWAPYNQPFTVRVGTVSGGIFSGFATETAPLVVSGNVALDAVGDRSGTGTGWFFTLTFDTPIPLQANTTYAFAVELNAPYIEVNGNGTTDGNYAEGTAITVPHSVNSGADTVYTGDRVFHLDIVEITSMPVTHYVDVNNATPVYPFTNWVTAATSIQDAVNAAAYGDMVLVTNGTYDAGATITPGYSCLNRVVISKNTTVQSVNGPEVTIIVGAEATGGGNGDNAVRGVYMSAGVLSGFTVTNGYTSTSGDYSYDRSGGGVNMYGGSGVVSNCVISSNSANENGGGSYGGTLTDCTLMNNSASWNGGGSYGGTLNNCTLTGNIAYGWAGGGNCECTLNNCTLTANSAAYSGGGSAFSTLNNCTLTFNSAVNDVGGGSASCTLNNCTLAFNSAGNKGGGSENGTLNNCTLIFNRAGNTGGGSEICTLNNCIAYYNSAGLSGDNWNGGSCSYSCTTPDPGGTGNITNSPMLVNFSHIHADSPCVGAGSSAYVSGTDLDGDAWGSPPAIGCDEPLPPFDGEISVSISAEYTTVANDCELSFLAEIVGEVSSNRWTFGDGTFLSNIVYVQHGWAATGTYEVVLTAWNDDHPGGVSDSVQVQVVEGGYRYYVDAANASPVPPYSSWATAATNIQDAVDEAEKIVGSKSTVWVTNGVYNAGGAVAPGHVSMNRVLITDDIAVRSVNGPEVTFIVGAEATEGYYNGPDAVRGVYMSAGVLSGFTITNGHTRADTGNDAFDRSGGGVNMVGGSGVVSNCVLTGNLALSSGGGSRGGTLTDCTLSGNMVLGGSGGGSYGGTLTGCSLLGNGAAYYGGGSCNSTLTDCTLMGNFALGSGWSGSGGGGSCDSTLTNCTLTGNLTRNYGGGSNGDTLNHCSLSGNSARYGGGSYEGLLNNCTLTDNSADYGGGSYDGTLNNCTLIGNSATLDGGGSCYGTLTGCALSGNSADWNGGGSNEGTLYDCLITGNAAFQGGGSNGGTLNNCLIMYNWAEGWGGGSEYGTLNNCVITGNSAGWMAGGNELGTLYNCIIYFNTAGAYPYDGNCVDSTLAYCCTTPDPGGIGNITDAPLFISSGNYRLASNSPCINSGDNDYVSIATDLDGNPRIVDGTVDMGAYESGFTGCYITGGYASGSDVYLEWTAFPMWQAMVKYSTNLVTMPFTDLSAPMPYPIDSYTDLIYGSEDQCFYKIEISPY